MLLVASFAQPTAASAGTTGILNGVVWVDAREFAAPEHVGRAVHLRVELLGPDGIRRTETDSQGFFAFVGLPPGRYLALARPEGSPYGYGCSSWAIVVADQVTNVVNTVIQRAPFDHCYRTYKPQADFSVYNLDANGNLVR
jgi:hypothetical protein